MDSSYEKAKNWLTDSGIFVSNESEPNFGAVHSFYDEKTKEFAFLYPEITGYFSSTMRFLHEHENNEKFVNLAKYSCSWLMQLFKKYGGIVQGIGKDTSKNKIVYSFDTAICAKGSLDCYELTKDSNYLDFSKKLLSWISREALEDDGTIKPLKNLESDNFEESSKMWYTQKGCLHIKSSMPFLQYYKLTNDESFLNHGLKILKSIDLFQQNDGSIFLHQKSNLIHLHSLCYALEGLLYAYHITQNNQYLTKCKKSLEWCVSKIENDGSIQLWYNSKYPKAKTSYHIAQVIRLMILVNAIEKNGFFSDSINKLYSFMISLQAQNSIKESNGGFYEELYKSIFGWKKRLRINSWGSMFALQAIYWNENIENLSKQNSVEFLF